MRVNRLTLAGQDRPRESVNALELEEMRGVLGDHKSEKDGSVSLLSGEVEQEISSLGGLCNAKFAANIVTEGLDFTQLSQGMRVKIAGAELEITRVGKHCYEACEMLQAGDTCPLPTNCAFARVTRGGEIHAGDEIQINHASER